MLVYENLPKFINHTTITIVFVRNFRMPFNWKTPIGYLVTFSYEYLSIFYVGIFCACNLLFPASFCWLISTFILDIQSELSDLNENYEMSGNSVQLNEKLCRFIELHQIAKQFS